jgi:hypothetical protein
MTELTIDRSLPQLELPSAVLNMPSHRGPHVDSEEAVRYERRRVSQELEHVRYFDISSGSPVEITYTNDDSPSYASLRSLRSHNAASRSQTVSQEHLRCHNSVISGSSTQPGTQGASETGGQSIRPSMRTSHWYDPTISFWTTHVSITIEDGAHRDHLGTCLSLFPYLNFESHRAQHSSAPS